MEFKKIIFNGEEIEFATKLDPEYFEVNHDLDVTLDLSNELSDIKIDGDDNE